MAIRFTVEERSTGAYLAGDHVFRNMKRDLRHDLSVARETEIIAGPRRPLANNGTSFDGMTPGEIELPRQVIVLREGSGGPRRIRTPDPLIRSQVLYPAELSVRGGVR